ncbi:hypothetical protein AURDEDRAFT_113491, partial [Auricularia subglabra TFB-10046 SS5]
MFPDFLLADVLDYLLLGELLLAAMPVNRYWRQCAINHRLYWYDLELTEHCPDSVLQSVPLFLLRLSRTHARPVRVRVEHDEPGAAVIAEVSQHLSHITFLYLHILQNYASQAVEALRTQGAPVLTAFYLAVSSQAPDSDPITVPSDIFASTAPVLEHVDLTDIELTRIPRLYAFL